MGSKLNSNESAEEGSSNRKTVNTNIYKKPAYRVQNMPTKRKLDFSDADVDENDTPVKTFRAQKLREALQLQSPVPSRSETLSPNRLPLSTSPLPSPELVSLKPLSGQSKPASKAKAKAKCTAVKSKSKPVMKCAMTKPGKKSVTPKANASRRKKSVTPKKPNASRRKKSVTPKASTSASPEKSVTPKPSASASPGKKSVTPKDSPSPRKKSVTPKASANPGKKSVTPKASASRGKKSVTPKAKASRGKKSVTPKAKASPGKKSVTPKAKASRKKSVTPKAKARFGKKCGKAVKELTPIVKKSGKTLKMTRECIYSRGYHNCKNNGGSKKQAWKGNTVTMQLYPDTSVHLQF